MARGTMHAKAAHNQDKATRRNRNSSPHDTISLTRDGEVRGPSLEELTGRASWPAEVITWYETWRRAPQAQAFESTDWSRLGLLASIVESYVNKPGAAALSEIRMNEERLGATVVDRMRARMRIAADDSEAAPVVQLADARKDIAARLRGSE